MQFPGIKDAYHKYTYLAQEQLNHHLFNHIYVS